MNKDVDQLTDLVHSWYYGLLLPIGLILAGIVILIGGIMYASSSGDAARAQKAKEIIFGAITGLVLLICAALIVRTVTGT
jgi:hypothetical protein